MSEELLRQEVARLEARAAMLERQLEAHERAAAEQSRRLEEAISDARIRAEQVARSEEELRQQASILRLVLDSMADGVAVVDEAGRLVLQNPAADRMLGRLPASPEARGSRAPERFDAVAAPVGLFLADQVTPWPATEHPLARALRGEAVDQVELFARPPQPEPRSSSRPDDDTEPRSMRVPPRLDRLHPDGLFLAVTASPMRRKDGSISGAVAVFRDTTEAKRLVEGLEAKNRDLSESEQAKTELVERLRLAIDEVSTPILELWDDVLALPIIGVVDSRRSVQIMERLLDEIVHRQSRFVIIDLTGVEIIDTRTADYFTRLIKAVELLGARCRITGVRPAVAQALVDIGINLGAVRASRTLKHALRDLLRRTGKRIARAIADGRARPALAAGAARKNDDDAALAPRSSQMRPLAGKES